MTITLDSVAEFVATSVSPLVERLTDDAGVTAFVAELGWDLPSTTSVPPVFLEIHDSAAALRESLGHLTLARLNIDEDGAELAGTEVTAAFALVVANIDSLDERLQNELPAAYLGESGIAGAIGRRLLDYLIVNAIRRTSYITRAVLFALGIIEEKRQPADSGRHQPAFTLREFRLDRLRTFFESPSAVLADTYGWGTPYIDEERLYETINILSFGLNASAELGFQSEALINSMFPNLPPNTEVGTMLNIPIARAGVAALEVGVFPAPKQNPADIQGLAFRLIGTPEATVSFGIGAGMALTLAVRAALDTGVGLLLLPGSSPQLLVGVESAASVMTQGGITLELGRTNMASPLRVLSLGDSVTLDVSSFHVALGLEAAPADLSLSAAIDAGRLEISLAEADGFIQSVVPSESLGVDFAIGIGWSKARGVFITGSAGLEMLIVVNLTVGPVFLQAVRVVVRLSDDGLRVQAGLHAGVVLGPVTTVVQGLGMEARLAFESGNLGPMDLGVSFLPPFGLGVLVDAGVVRGGGFLAFEFDAHRYSGTLELSVFSISVKAFGLVETVLPDGTDGFSFVIIIVAEFTPIQLGFGFTLIGVGGMIGIHRGVNEQGLGDAVRTGSLEHLLFPRNPVRDAPAIVHDLSTVFPAAKGHYIFGPMAKFGWGTPTLITADLGIIIEFPGPRLGVLGVVRMLLPRPDFALLSLQMAVAGILDFPAKRFSLDAGLYDSHVVGYQVTGDMAYRLGFGNNAAFLLTVGGFNPSFDAPPGVPELRRAAVDLGVNGNPSLVASGYFALTSNTAQIGASLELNASGHGLRLHGWLGFDALFVFSPFSFTASISAGVRVSFHGAGIGVTLHGSLSGPTPWRFNGKVCVSVLWWDACLPIELKFGSREPAALPEIDPWLGRTDDDLRISVRGLQEAIQDSRSWSGSNPPAGFSVVSLAAAATAERTPIDPLGAATLRQKVVPLNQKIEKFGEYEPLDHDEFNLSSVIMNGDEISEVDTVEDDFAPAHFLELTNAERLSMASYVPMDAGFSIAPNRVTLGSTGSQVLEYETKYINAQGQLFINQPVFRLTDLQLRGLLRRSAPALKGSRRSGVQKYIVPNKPKKVTFGPKKFVVADACSSVQNSAITADGVSQVKALLALRSHVAANPTDEGRYTVMPSYAAA